MELKSVVLNGIKVVNMTMHDIVYTSGGQTIVFPGNKEACVRVTQ